MSTNKFKNTIKKKENSNSILSFIKNRKLQISLGFLILGFSIFLFISLLSHFYIGKLDHYNIETFKQYGFQAASKKNINNNLGLLGAIFSYFFSYQWFGYSSILIPIFLFIVGYKLVYIKSKVNIFKSFNVFIFSILWSSISLGLAQNNFSYLIKIYSLSGYFGIETVNSLSRYLGEVGVLILLITSLIILIVSLVDFSHISFSIFKKQNDQNPNSGNSNDDSLLKNIDTNIDNQNEIDLDTKTSNEKNLELFINEPPVDLENKKNSDSNVNNNISINLGGLEDPFDPKLDLSNYNYPTYKILKDHHNMGKKVSREELELNKIKIVDTLTNFKIGIASIKATIGPTVTLYEIIPEAGIKISKIKNLEDDIALSLSALGIRIIAPIPGKGTIGIEVPNKNREVVSFKSCLSSEKFKNTKAELPVILGKTISNEVLISDLSQMPHLLIAGATGQGKSVGINTILASLLYKKHPSQLKLVLVDPKKVELSLFTNIERHFLAKLPSSPESIITATKEVVHTLNSLCIEMDTRYELLKEAGTRNIKEYNYKFINRRLSPKQGHRYLPYIVLVIDEFADMIMTAGKEIETPVARLAQLARAIGIHLVLATQRPSVNVITGTIKANFPARISYKVSSKIDSRTILDYGGAQQLVGRGDMLFSSSSDIIRLQSPFIDTQEIENLCEFISKQQSYSSAYKLPIYEEPNNKTPKTQMDEKDSMFEEAARLIVTNQQGSTSLIQRRLKLGYNRAGRLIDQLEAAGIVGPFEGSKSRQVLVNDEYSLEQLLKNV